MKQRAPRRAQLARADHPEHDAVAVPVDRDAGEQAAKNTTTKQPVAAEQPAEPAEKRPKQPESSAQALTRLPRRRAGGSRLRSSSSRSSSVEPARRPVGLRRVAAARAVERGDVLQRDEDVPVQLDVRDVVDEQYAVSTPSW